jgi:hypothetical protein
VRCYVHQDREAEAKCSVCQKPICSECTTVSEGGSRVCSRCSIIHAAREADGEIHERVVKTASRKRERSEREERVSRLKLVVPLIILGLAAIAGGLVYFKSSIPEVERFQPSENPMAAAVVVDQAIKDYARDHNGRVPDDLQELRGAYLPPDVVGEADIDMFDYSKSSPDSYELLPKLMNIEGHPEISFTERGIKTGPDNEATP